MVNANLNTLGIIFPNSYDTFVPDLVNVRLMGSIPFASRYRMIDFMLSSMSNCGIDTVAAIVNNNYQSVIDHLGSGRSWDLVRKNGGLKIFPPYADIQLVQLRNQHIALQPLFAQKRCLGNQINQKFSFQHDDIE